MSNISTHILDTTRGLPAPDVAVSLEARRGDEFHPVSSHLTNTDGRVGGFLPEGEALAAGVYRLTFTTGEYFAQLGVEAFYPEVQITFQVHDGGRHHHVPLLLNAYGFTTYRGS